MSNDITRIKNLLSDLEEEPLLALVKERLAANDDAMAIVEACRDGMQMVGERFAAQEYFVSELVASAEIFNEVMSLIGPRLSTGRDNVPVAKVVFGTVQGDIHDIGKNIVCTLLATHGFEIIDIGKNVPADTIIKKAVEKNADMIGLSALMTTTIMEMDKVIRKLKESNLKIPVIVGGAVVTQSFADKIGAVLYAKDALQAVEKLKRFLQGRQRE